MKSKPKERDKRFYIEIAKLSEMFYSRIYGEKRNIYPSFRRRQKQSLHPANNKKNLWDALDSLMVDAWNKELLRQEKCFQRNFRLTYQEARRKAIEGDDQNILNLVSFDKRELFENYTRKRIIRAQAEEDFDFFNKLGSAIKRKVGQVEDFSGKESEKQRTLRKLLRILSVFKYDFNKNEAEKELMEIIDEVNKSYPDERLPYITHTGVLRKTLKRMGLKG